MTPLKLLSRNRLAVAGIVFVLALAGFVSCNLTTHRRDPRLAAIRLAGYPVTPAELDDWYPHVPDAENAALIYTNAFAKMVYTESNANDRRRISDIKLPPRGEVLTGKDKTDLKGMIASNAPALLLLYSAASFTNSRYPVDLKLGFEVLLPHLPGVKGAAMLLSAESTLHAANREPQKALGSLAAATQVASSLNCEPLLVSQLARFASWGAIVSRLEHLLNVAKFSEAKLATMQTALADAEQPAASSRALAGERASILAIFDDPKMQGQFLFSNDPNTNMETRLKTSLFTAVVQLTKDRDYFLETMRTNVDAASRPYPVRFTAGRQASAALGATPNRFYIISSMLLPDLSKFHIREAEHIARIRVGQTALPLNAIASFMPTHSPPRWRNWSPATSKLFRPIPATGRSCGSRSWKRATWFTASAAISKTTAGRKEKQGVGRRTTTLPSSSKTETMTAVGLHHSVNSTRRRGGCKSAHPGLPPCEPLVQSCRTGPG